MSCCFSTSSYRDYRSALRASDSSTRKNLLRSAAAHVPEARAAYEEILRQERKDAVVDAETQGRKETEKVKTEADKRREEYDKLVDAAADVRRRIDAKDWKGARDVMETALTTPKAKKFYDDLEGPLRKLERETKLDDLDAAAASGDCEKFDRAYREARALRESSEPEVRRRLSEAILRLAQKLLGDRRWKEAVRWLYEYEELAGKVDASILESRSLALAQSGDFERAGKEFDRLRAHLGPGKAPSPALAVIPYERAKKAADRQGWTEALRELTLATQVDPTHARAYHDRGLLRYRAERLAREAISEDLAKAFELDSALRPDALYQDAALSFTRRQVEEYAKAESPAEREAAWREAARLLGIVIARLDSAELRLRRSQMYLRLAAYRPALDDAALAGESQEASLVRGKISYAVAISEGRDRRKLQDAAGEFSRAIERNPKAALAYYWRGTCRTVLGDAKGATEDFEAAAGLGVLSPYMNYQLSRIYADLKKFDQALEYATRALGGADSLTEDDFIARHFEDEHLPWSAALRLFKRDAYLARGEARFNRREFGDSAADCTAAIDLDRELPASYLWRAYAACKDKRHKDAQNDCREFITRSKVPADREVARQFLEQCLEHSKE